MARSYFAPVYFGLILSSATVSSVVAVQPETFLLHNFGDWTIKPQIGVSEMYTDNLYYGNNNSFTRIPAGVVRVPGTQRVEFVGGTNVITRPQVDDFLTVVTPGLQIQYGATPENRIRFVFGHDEQYYSKHSFANTSQDRIDLQEQVQFGRFIHTGSDAIHYLDSFIGGGLSLGLIPIQRRAVTLDHRVTFDYSEKTDFYGAAHFDQYDYPNNSGFFGQNTLSGTAGFSYHVLEKLIVFSEGFYGQTASHSSAPQSPKVPFSQFFGGFVGVRGELTPKIEGMIKVGFDHREYGAGGPSASSPAFDISLNYAAGPKTVSSLSYIRRTGVSFLLASQSYVSDAMILGVSQQIGTTGVWAASGNISYSHGEYGPTHSGPTIYPARVDNTISVGARLIYSPAVWWNVSLGYSLERFSTDAVYYQTALDPVNAGQTLRFPNQTFLVDYLNHRITLQLSMGY